MNCKELVELVTEYLEGSLPPPEKERFEKHLSGCTGCTHYLEQMRQTIQLTGMLREEQVPDEPMNALKAAFRNWRNTR